MKHLVYGLRILISALFLLSAIAKLYPTPIYGITKIFEEGQLIPMGFSESFVPYLSRFIIGFEFFLAFTILFDNYLKKFVVPVSILMITVFSVHLSTQIFSSSQNCGCFGELIPMTPFEALLKNLLTLVVLGFIYLRSIDIRRRFSDLIVFFLIISTMMFAFIPVSSTVKSSGGNFLSYVADEDFQMIDDRKILCFFDAGCEHCEQTARSLDSLSNVVSSFPNIYIVFSDAEEYRIPDFFEFVGNKYPYQVMPFANYDTDEIDSYMEITFPDYDNPVVILYDGSRQVRLYEGTGERSFSAKDLKNILESK
tara:strand:+ start:532 stop:1461 length:930 start_codon:yes stop_codon:yes gene_type:complete